MKSSVRRGESVVVLGAAAALVALCAMGLGTFLTSAEAVEGAAPGSAPIEEAAISDEAQAPAGLDVKVDTRGIELPEGSVSAQYAVAAAADIAERAYGQAVTGRAQAVLYNSETTFARDYDIISGLYWIATVETEDGLVDATIVAATGVDYDSSFGPFPHEGWARDFDSWDGDTGNGGLYGTEEELVASRKEYPEPEPLMDDEQIADVYAMKREGMMEWAESVAGEPHVERAMEIVNERGLGNGASATSGRILMSGGGGPLEAEPLSYYVVEVALDDGTYLFADIGVEDLALYGWERSPVDMPTRLYG